jgi:hypothetical protein
VFNLGLHLDNEVWDLKGDWKFSDFFDCNVAVLCTYKFVACASAAKGVFLLVIRLTCASQPLPLALPCFICPPAFLPALGVFSVHKVLSKSLRKTCSSQVFAKFLARKWGL